jgi:hypothetical protein
VTDDRTDGSHGPGSNPSKLRTLATKKSRCWRNQAFTLTENLALSDAVGESIPTQCNSRRVSQIALAALFGVSNPPMVGLGEPLAETLRCVTIGHQFPFTGKLAFLSVRSSFAVLEMSVGWRDFVQPFPPGDAQPDLAVQAVALCALFLCSEAPATCNNAGLSQVRVRTGWSIASEWA